MSGSATSDETKAAMQAAARREAVERNPLYEYVEKLAGDLIDLRLAMVSVEAQIAAIKRDIELLQEIEVERPATT